MIATKPKCQFPLSPEVSRNLFYRDRNRPLIRLRRIPVTIAIGFEFDGGLLFYADTKVTTTIKTNAEKIAHRAHDTEDLSLTFAMSSTDMNFPIMAVDTCWNYIKASNLQGATIDTVHQYAQFSLGEFYRDHIYSHPDRTPGAVFLELLVGIRFRGETRLYVSHETVLNRVDQYESIGSGAYLAKYLIRQYQAAAPSRSLTDAAFIANFAVHAAIGYDEHCGGEARMLIVGNDGALSHAPAFDYPGTELVDGITGLTWKMLHRLAQVEEKSGKDSDAEVERYCAEVRKLHDSLKWGRW